MRRLLFTAMALTLGSSLQAAEPCATLDKKAIAALFDDWNFALSSMDPDQVTQRYWSNAVLLPTMSNTPRTTPAMIADYFEHFLAKRPRGRIDTRTVQTGCNMAMDMGTYSFSLMDDRGVTSEVAGRYTFIYQYRDGAWKILHHHSSAMPERSAISMSVADNADEHESAPSPAAHAEPSKPARPATLKDRREKRTSMAKPVPVAAAPVAKHDPAPAAKKEPAAGAKPAADSKAAASGAMPEPKAAPEVKTAMFANLTMSPPPSKFYPAESARQKERGNVNLKVCSDGNGAVSEVLEILKSSGSKHLDEAAISWAREATWVPATVNNQRVEGCTQVDVGFEPSPAMAHARP